MTIRPAKPPSLTPRIPGDPGVWVLIFGDLFVFALLFATFAYYRAQTPAVFVQSQRTLSQASGILNTLLLLSSSLLVVCAIAFNRRENFRAAQRCVAGAIGLGFGFVACKAMEYTAKISSGHYPVTNDFYMLYYALTGLHLVHGLVGLGGLAYLRVLIAKPATHSPFTESLALFWHMVDLLWVILFAILYMHR
ncbi:cytochrome c oxidase subunit 3 [Qipengyuania sp.]|uniref:cytochrome c oxidase subunit 3 n=1 Tax=Qipengyuania sp. TaxID=2004515 RepID=UPI0035C7F495